MTVGRTLEKYTRVYMDGYNLSGFGRTIGPLEVTYDEADVTATMSDEVRGYMRNNARVNLGTFNAVFDNTASTGIHALLETAGDARTVLVAKGIRARPAVGDPCFGGKFEQGAYQVTEDGGAMTVTIPWMGWAADAGFLDYVNPWGVLLHALGAETGANSTNGVVSNPEEGSTALGGYLVYQITASAGSNENSATLSIDDSADGSTGWGALSGATTGSIDTDNPVAGIIAIGRAATVKKFTRWQLSTGDATSVTFALAFFRAF